ncbi:MAG: succinyl-CoA--3-ketoacid-CoA transferase [Dehalococcoidia bacterium]|nr:succinyl-CoA--3-ketoacid-CoA transferase [Dehalococcoidia bacterium]
MKERLSEEVMAMRAAKELEAGDSCNLGLGTPQLCALYVPEGIQVQAENGVLGYGPLVTTDNAEMADPALMDAGSRFYTPAPGMSFFDMLTSFAMIRSGRLTTILGGLEVSEKGDLAIHAMSEADEYPQIGGAMDLAWGAKKLIVTMTHNTRDGKSKIVKELSLPLSSPECVDIIVTDLAVIEVTPEGLVLKEVAPGWTAQEVQALTEARLVISEDVKEVEL